jgi:Arc/MetJ-type ribon-helix-helix transcriptional regulator
MSMGLPGELKDFVDDQVKRGYGTSSDEAIGYHSRDLPMWCG